MAGGGAVRQHDGVATRCCREVRQAAGKQLRGGVVGRRGGAGGGSPGSRVAFFFGGKQKRRSEMYVGWLAGTGVLAHFGAGQIQLKIFTSMLYFIFGAQPNFGFLAKFHRNLLHNIGHHTSTHKPKKTAPFVNSKFLCYTITRPEARFRIQ